MHKLIDFSFLTSVIEYIIDNQINLYYLKASAVKQLLYFTDNNILYKIKNQRRLSIIFNYFKNK